MLRVPFISCFALLSVVACGGRDPVDDHAANATGLPDVNVPAPSATGEPRGPTTPASAEPTVAAAKIPTALQGRWALAPRDCTSNRGDAKGLLVITPDDLRFYESRAVPAEDVGADKTSIAGNFAFTGEGQGWTKYEALKVEKQTLTRTETKPTASFSYAKCS